MRGAHEKLETNRIPAFWSLNQIVQDNAREKHKGKVELTLKELFDSTTNKRQKNPTPNRMTSAPHFSLPVILENDIGKQVTSLRKRKLHK